jgi:hypothetical protein
VDSFGAGPFVTGEADSVSNVELNLSKSKKANGGRLQQHDKNVRKKASVGVTVKNKESNKGKETRLHHHGQGQTARY